MSLIFSNSEPMSGHPSVTPEVVAQALGADPTDGFGRGTLTGLRMGYSAPGSIERAAFDALADVPLREREIPQPHQSPMVTTPSTGGTEGRALTAGDIAFLAGVPDDPAKVSAADAQLVAQIRTEVRAPSDVGAVDRVYQPLKAFHDGLQRITRLEATAIRNGPGGPGDSQGRRKARQWLVRAAAEHMATGSSELTVEECERRVDELVKERLVAEDVQRVQARTAALNELREACEQTGLRSKVLDRAATAPPPPPAFL